MFNQYLEPPDYLDPAECCEEIMDIDNEGILTCFKCGTVIHPNPDIEPIPDIELPDDYGPKDSDVCSHGVPYGVGCDHHSIS